MNFIGELKTRFAKVIAEWVAADELDKYLDMIRPSQNPDFGDFQANMAMPLKPVRARPPREIAQEIVDAVDVSDFCEEPEIAGPGFINLRIKNQAIVDAINQLVSDDRVGVPLVEQPKTFVIDYSSPNVAKPMHVGHIRSTVIGDSLCRTLRFVGHKVISDNHLGDWGTQFGMIIFGYKNFVDRDDYDKSPVPELSRLYRLVNQIIDYYKATQKLPETETKLAKTSEAIAKYEAESEGDDAKASKAAKKQLKKARKDCSDLTESIKSLKETLTTVDGNEPLKAIVEQHSDAEVQAQTETAKLHEGDETNVALWEEFLPHCREALQQTYQRLDIDFDHELGESFYHSRLASSVSDLFDKGIAKESEGAICVFLDDFEAPMIVRKSNVAFLYATTDLATIQYRMEEWKPDAILYVVDTRQGEHFDKLFAAARLWGYGDVELSHIRFGTVTGPDGKPYKTRSGGVAGLEYLLDEAVENAYAVVKDNENEKADRAKEENKEVSLLSEEQMREIADVVGHAAVKYADLSHNRERDYVFDLEKMVATEGNTATYMQYAYARTQQIIAKSGEDIDAMRNAFATISIDTAHERALVFELLQFPLAVEEVVAEYFPSVLTTYMYDLAKQAATFYTQCPVLKAESPELRSSRLLLCDLTGRVLKQGLALLGIPVVSRM